MQYTVTNLQTLPGCSGSDATAINNRGQVVGTVATPQGNHAFVYDNSAMSDLGTLPNGSNGIAYSINDSGQVVGGALTSANEWHACLFGSSTVTDLGTLPDDNISVARAINNNGLIAGDSQGTQGSRPVLFSGSSIIYLGNVLGGVSASAMDINDGGQVVAQENLPGGIRSVLFPYNGSTAVDLGTLPNLDCRATTLNNKGQVAGSRKERRRRLCSRFSLQRFDDDRPGDVPAGTDTFPLDINSGANRWVLDDGGRWRPCLPV